MKIKSHHIYSNQDLNDIKKYHLSSKCASANKRFEHRILIIDVLTSLKRSNFKCVYCSDTLKPDKWQLDHFNPRAMGGKNSLYNLAPSCKWCNQMKNALDGYSFLIRCKKIFRSNLDTQIPSSNTKGVFVALVDFGSKKIKESED